MDIYKTTDGYDEIVDLDDLKIYPAEWLELKSYDLWLMAEKEAGVSLFYMQFLEHQAYTGYTADEQILRVWSLCDDLVEMRVSVIEDSPEARLKVMKWIYKFQDEVENQC